MNPDNEGSDEAITFSEVDAPKRDLTIGNTNKADISNSDLTIRNSNKAFISRIWKPGDTTGVAGYESEWKLMRDYNWTFDKRQLNGLPPQNVILDDFLLYKIMVSGVSGDDRYRRWPVNFQPCGYLNGNLLGTGRAAKVYMEGEWRYLRSGAVELHGQEGQKAGNPRKGDSSLYPKTATSSISPASKCVLQTDEIYQEDFEYTHRTIKASFKPIKGERKMGQCAVKPSEPRSMGTQLFSTPGAAFGPPLSPKKRSSRLANDPPLSSPRKKMKVPAKEPGEDDRVTRLSSTVSKLNGLMMETGDLAYKLSENRNTSAFINQWREIALRYNNLLDEIDDN